MMANEINILIPEVKDNTPLDIKIFSASKQICAYRLEVFSYDKEKAKESRADFVKEKIDNYSKHFSLMEVGFIGDQQIRLLFKHEINL